MALGLHSRGDVQNPLSEIAMTGQTRNQVYMEKIKADALTLWNERPHLEVPR